jgi:hypothetical protein
MSPANRHPNDPEKQNVNPAHHALYKHQTLDHHLSVFNAKLKMELTLSKQLVLSV